MKVIAKKGTKCPKEKNPREYITDTEPVEVSDDSIYYRRLIADGSLIKFTENNTESKDNSKGGKK